MAMIVLMAPLVASSPLARSTMLLPKYLSGREGRQLTGFIYQYQLFGPWYPVLQY